MANKDDYLNNYRKFFEYFAQTVNPNDQLPVKLGSYKILNLEVVGGIIDWTSQYLSQKKCPEHLVAPLIKIVIEEIRKGCKKQPINYGFNSSDNAYEPLKLMQAVMAKINEVCLRYLDNSMLCSLPAPTNVFYETSICARRNRRRRMEDRHVVIHDLNTMFNIQETSPSSYFAIFDGHAGHDAASYSAAHLHQYLTENKYFASNLEQALKDAFCKTDALFLEKCNVESLTGGTTAVVALLRPKEKSLYIAWVGDSQALLVKQGKILQCVNPHKPCREDERARIEKAGGCVMHWGTWRVNGQLAVSRAIGDADYKPHVTAIPDVKEIALDGDEDFLIIACDGLWDYLSEDAAAQEVYYMIAENSDDTERISKHLAQLACYQGSTDNISVIVVFLRDPHQIAAEAPRWANKNGPTLSASNMEAGLDNANNPFTNSNGSLKNLDVVDADNINLQKSANDGLLLNLTDNFKANGTDLSKDIFGTEKSNGTKKSVSEAPFDDDFGPETNVDDLLSPIEKEKAFTESLVKGLHGDNLSSLHNDETKSAAEGLVNNNPFDGTFNPFSNNPLMKENNETKEFDFEEFCSENREETPTPPAEEVHDGGLEVNPTESDSEDEWNYIKGDQANPETIPLQPETVVEASESDDAMSQLNPNAAEFVPVSPTRSVPSPACHNLIKEEVLSQSPKRPEKVDFSKVPSENEFECEVKSRPSDFDKNGHDSDLDVSIGDKIEGLLNGKNIDEIPEFLPGSTPAKPSDEFHFGPNAAPFTPKVFDQSEVSTKAEYGDDTAQLNASFDSELTLPKEEDDPMSMSFYAEKGEANPFENEDDLNKVHKVPDNLDDFLGDFDNKENMGFNETISDLPEHDPLGLPLDNDAAVVQTTDLDKLSQDDEKELASPLDAPSEPIDSNVSSESAEVNIPKECDDVATKLQYVETELEKGDTELLVLSPQPDPQLENVETELLKEATTEAEFLPMQPDLAPPTIEPLPVSPAPEAVSPIPDPKLIHSPVREKSDLLNIDEVASSSLSEADDVPIVSNNEEPIPESQPLSEQVVLISEPEQFSVDLCAPAVALNVTKEENSPKCEVDFLTTEEPDILGDLTAAPVPECEYSAEPQLCALSAQAPPSPVDLIQEIKQEEEITSSVKDDVSSPVEQISHSSVFDDSVKEDIVVGACELRQPLLETPVSSLPVEHSSPSEINDFEPSAPVESSFNGLDNFISEPNEQICIKTDSIIPEFAEPAVLTPSEESKAVDDVNAPSPLPSHTEISFNTLQEPPQPESLLTSQTVLSPESSVPEIVPHEDIIVPEVEVVQPGQITAVAELPLETVAVATSEKVMKKPIGKVEPRKFTSPSPRTGTAKPSTKSPINASKSGVTGKIPPKAPTSKPAGAAPKATSAVSSRPLSKPKTATTKPTETNKPAATANLKAVPKTLTRKTPTDPPATKTFTRPTTTAAKTSPAKLPATRPNSAPRSLSSKPAVSAKAPAAPKPRVPLSSRTATTAAAASKTTTSTITKSTTTTTKTLTSPKPTPASPKPRTLTSVTAKPRVPLTKTVTKSADVEKEKKESANKLTASRATTVTKTASSNLAGKTTTTTVKKTETKQLSDRTVASKTSTTTRTLTLSKRPADLKTISKTKTTKIEKPKENGVAPANVTEEITIVNNVVNQAGTETLVKDNSPLDNKLLIETSNSLIDTTPAD
ncbi:uncharacterized protein [Euwallacea similis]|uniref:uncharacterized protein isoform X2 n=1 Tax=Euwallacea similis TaxID=1736056 RepID=UPI00344CB40E